MKCFAVVSALAIIGLSPPVGAVPLTGSWDVVDQGTPADPMKSGDLFTTTWTATANETAQVTDLLSLGDNYEIYVNGALVDTTTALSYTDTGNGPFGFPYTPDPNVAWATTGKFAFAHASFSVLTGDIVSIRDISIPPDFPDGTVAIRSISGVPEPSSWTMALLGFLGAGSMLALRKRRAGCAAQG